MCIFSAHVASVSNTNIFARSANDGRQYLVYSMKYEAADELAMILPLPTPPDSPEDSIRFINLSDYRLFFNDLRLGFPERQIGWTLSLPPSIFGLPPQQQLKVHEVGSFEASFVPRQDDFARLDKRFRLPSDVWDKLPQYSDWGFAVFKLKAKNEEAHPMAFEFPRRNPEELFFPTVHIHDGEVHTEAEFDHDLYCQFDFYSDLDWEYSYGQAASFMKIDKSQGLIDATQPVQHQLMRGVYKNEDIVVRL